jgi:RNA polymerase sigma factor (sigma-70 family)
VEAHAQLSGRGGTRRRGPLLGLLGDERLARLVAGGDDRAFASLYERHHQALYRYCRSLAGTDADAHDALQSTFTAALVALRRGQRDAPLRPWLFRIAHNESISLLRRRRGGSERAEASESATPSAAQVAADRERLRLLVADLQELPERQRGALVMRELSGLSHEEIAQALDISTGAAKQTVFEARQSLIEFAEGRAMACEEILRVVSDGDRRALRGRRVRAHLRDCSRCSAFAAAIPARQAELKAVAPALPAIAAASLFTRIMGGGSGHGGGSGLVAGATGKSVGAALSAKTMGAGAALVATAAVGATGVIHHFTHSSPRSHAAVSRVAPPSPRAGATAAGADASKTLRVDRADGGVGSARAAVRVSAGRSRPPGAAPGPHRSTHASVSPPLASASPGATTSARVPDGGRAATHTGAAHAHGGRAAHGISHHHRGARSVGPSHRTGSTHAGSSRSHGRSNSGSAPRHPPAGAGASGPKPDVGAGSGATGGSGVTDAGQGAPSRSGHATTP